MLLHTRGTAMPAMRHTGAASDGMCRSEKTRFEGKAVDVHGVFAVFGGNIFIEGSPRRDLAQSGCVRLFLARICLERA